MFKKRRYQISSIKDLDNFINQQTTIGGKGWFNESIMEPKILELYNIYLAGKRYNKALDFPSAISFYRKALQIAPTFVAARCNLGKALINIGDYNQAVHELNAAANLAPNDPDIWNLIGEAHLELSNENFALGAYMKALSINPNHVWAKIGLGTYWWKYDELDEAERHYREALQYIESQTWPGFTGSAWDLELWHIYYRIHNVLWEQARHSDAIGYLEKCLALDPSEAGIRELLDQRRRDAKTLS